jgi:hypothetical protein
MNCFQKVATSLLGIETSRPPRSWRARPLIPAFEISSRSTHRPILLCAFGPGTCGWAPFLAPVAVAEGVAFLARQVNWAAGVGTIGMALRRTVAHQIPCKGTVRVGRACRLQLFRAVCFSTKIWVWPMLKRIHHGGNNGTQATIETTQSPTEPTKVTRFTITTITQKGKIPTSARYWPYLL